MDACTHEHDLRGALGVPGARDSDAASVGLEFAVGSWIHYGVKPAALPALQAETGERRWSSGPDPATTLRADAFELMRAVTGRRSLD